MGWTPPGGIQMYANVAGVETTAYEESVHELGYHHRAWILAKNYFSARRTGLMPRLYSAAMCHVLQLLKFMGEQPSLRRGGIGKHARVLIIGAEAIGDSRVMIFRLIRQPM